MKVIVNFFLFWFYCSFSVYAQNGIYQYGEIHFSENGYIEYRVGNMPLIIAAPHGGYDSPDYIPDRTCNNPVYVRDAYTLELTELVDTAFQSNFGCRPHIIINHLDRRKLDANRNLEDAACGNPDAEHAWQAFHYFIDIAKDIVSTEFEKGLFIDLHGHGHMIQRLELGYTLWSSTLAQDDETLNQPVIYHNSSIRHLVDINFNKFTHSELLRGEFSFGSLMENQEYPSVPSSNNPYPQLWHPYFGGGYNTQTHGSSAGGVIDAIQLECNMNGVRDTHENRKSFANTLAVSLTEFLSIHYFGNSDFLNCITGIDEQSNVYLKEPSIYPNPSIGFFTINLQDYFQSEKVNLSIHDLTGRTVYHRKLTEKRIMLNLQSILPNGYYMLVVHTDNTVFKSPLIMH